MIAKLPAQISPKVDSVTRTVFHLQNIHTVESTNFTQGLLNEDTLHQQGIMTGLLRRAYPSQRKVAFKSEFQRKMLSSLLSLDGSDKLYVSPTASGKTTMFLLSAVYSASVAPTPAYCVVVVSPLVIVSAAVKEKCRELSLSCQYYLLY